MLIPTLKLISSLMLTPSVTPNKSANLKLALIVNPFFDIYLLTEIQFLGLCSTPVI